MTADAVGGVWSYALDLARGLAPHGVETVLAVLGPAPDADQAAAARSVPGLRLLPTGLPLDWLAVDDGAVRAAAAALAALAAESGAELVHLSSPALAAEACFSMPVVAACHSCVATWWQAVRGGPMPAAFVWRTGLVGHGLRAADALVAPSAAFAQATARAYGLARPPAVVHNGRAAPPAAPTRRAAVFAFTAGRLWDDGKDVATLDRAAAALAIPVLAAGPVEGPDGTRVAPRHLRPLGRLDEGAIRRWLAAAPIFVSTARYEPFGLAVLEAAQAGCALVLADIPTFRELWDGAAEFVPPGDAAAVAAAVARAAGDAAHRAALGAASRARSRRYTAEAMAAGVLEVHRAALRGATREAVA
jgi:glycosyltransferase involved in cell wall biosynthesis